VSNLSPSLSLSPNILSWNLTENVQMFIAIFFYLSKYQPIWAIIPSCKHAPKSCVSVQRKLLKSTTIIWNSKVKWSHFVKKFVFVISQVSFTLVQALITCASSFSDCGS
jgi:hypothetical protein